MKTQIRNTQFGAESTVIPVAFGEASAQRWMRVNSYTAARLVQEQCNGAGKDAPVTFREAAMAVQDAMPELFADYWENLGQEVAA